jgi:hypothetical protein
MGTFSPHRIVLFGRRRREQSDRDLDLIIVEASHLSVLPPSAAILAPSLSGPLSPAKPVARLDATLT